MQKKKKKLSLKINLEGVLEEAGGDYIMECLKGSRCLV